MTDVTTPVPASTPIGDLIGGKLHGRNIITDLTGADVIGAAGTSPASGTLLGWLKAIRDLLAGTIGITATTLPLPTGAATATGVAAIATALGTPLQAGGTVLAKLADASGAAFGTSGNPINVTGISGGGGGGGGGAITAATGAIVDIGSASSPAAGTSNARLGQIVTALGAPTLPTGAATETTLGAINTKLGGTLAVSGTFWQATQPISASALPLPTGAATETTLSGMSGKLPSSIGAKVASNSLSVAPATDGFAVTTDAAAATNLFTITPHATNALGTIPRAIYVGTAGDITLRASGSSSDVVLKAVPAGSILPVRAQYVRVSGTTAADLVGLA